MARNNKPSPRDATGRKAAELREEKASELRERQHELSMHGDVTVVDDDEEDFTDLTNMQRHLAPGTRQPVHSDTETDTSGMMKVDGLQDPVKTNDTEIQDIGTETPFEVPGGTGDDGEVVRRVVDTRNAQRANVSLLGDAEPQPIRVQGSLDDPVTIRVNTALEQVTIGAGNTFDFMEGRRYRVPRWVAAHLEEKGYVYH